MNTLNLVKDDKVMLAITIKSEQEHLCVVEANEQKVVVKAGCLPVEITWERCSCHGGRMWFSQRDTNIYIELSSPEYDEENGITDPDTELAFYIDNKMIDTIKGFEKYVYVVEDIGKYTDEKVARRYFNSVEKASYFVFEESGHDVNSEYGSVTHQYPNENMRKRVTYLGEENGIIKFKAEDLSRNKNKCDNSITNREYSDDNDGFITTREYEIRFWTFRKK